LLLPLWINQRGYARAEPKRGHGSHEQTDARGSQSELESNEEERGDCRNRSDEPSWRTHEDDSSTVPAFR
jgi:hypothetical protein